MRATRFGRGFGLAAVLVVALLVGTFVPVGTLRAEAATGRPSVPTHRVDHVRPVDSTVGLAEKAVAGEALAATRASATRAVAEAQAVRKVRAAGGAGAARLVAGGPASGDYRATPLSASGAWTAGGSDGGFSWSYPLRVPPTAAGPKPELKLAYSSGSVDGRIVSSNNQTSWVGEGFDLGSSYVERSYGSCKEDGQTRKFDQCWRGDNVTVVLDGKSSELVHDDATGSWRLRDDDGSKVERLTGAANGALGGEHWQVTTTDGTRYVFGLDKLPGAGEQRTHSTWTVPVFGDDAGEPCHGATYSASWCVQAWRWNLDYVVDLHANAATYWYAEETNAYAKDGATSGSTLYTRGGYLTRIDYGQRSDTLFTADAAQRVVFASAERCVAAGSGCDALTEATRDSWPDVPFDAICAAGADCVKNPGPSFFSRKRLVGVTTQVSSGPGAFRDVDSWALKQSYLDAGEIGDTSDQTLWLDSIQQTGKAGTDVALPPVRFSATQLVNRVGTNSQDVLPMAKPRVSTIISETGGVTIVNYSAPECVLGSNMPTALDTNGMRCFPVKWHVNGAEELSQDWFHKYVVTHVLVADPTGHAPTVQTDYAYEGGAGWHYDDSFITPADRRTWSQWRGYPKVTTRSGDAGQHQRSKVVQYYMQGLDGDRQEGTTTRRAHTATGMAAPATTDSEQYAGFQLESVTFNGDTDDVVSGSVTLPWSVRTATDSAGGLSVSAWLTDTSSTQSRTTILGGTTPRVRTRTITNYFDAYGFATKTNDAGDDGVAGDETCARTLYARNVDVNLLELVSRVQTVGKACGVAPALPATSASSADVISDVATTFDSTAEWTLAQVPTRGDARWAGRAQGYTPDREPVWQRTAAGEYDALGRAISSTDTLGRTTATGYVPAGAGPVTGTVATNALGHVTTTTIDPAWGAATKVVDPNGKVVESTYDALGRATAVWTPVNNRASGQKPGRVFAYGVSAAQPSWSSVGELRNDATTYTTAYAFSDSQARALQTQSPSPRGGRIVTDTWYDTRGQVATTMGDVWDQGTEPSSTRVGTVSGGAPVQTETRYDGAGRPTTTTTLSYGVTKWSTTASYTGDSTATTAPVGGTASREYTDALGRVTRRLEYAGTSPTAATFLTTGFGYDSLGRSNKITGPDGAVWSTGYDLFGRTVTSTDPDKGTGTTTYDAADRVSSTKDSYGSVVATTYDGLDRKTGEYKTSVGDANRLTGWTYDPTGAKGQLATSTRYADGGPYTRTVTQYDDMYRPTRTSLSLPATDALVAAGVPQTMSWGANYTRAGNLAQMVLPSAGGLPSESISIEHTPLGLPSTMRGTSGYVGATVYSPLGDVDQLTLARSTENLQVWLTNTREAGTRRLTRSNVTDSVHPWMAQDLNYTYDTSGNVTSITDPATRGGTGAVDNQCFAYDAYQRLAQAWTPKTANCATTGRTVANLGGAAPYWTSYTYNTAGLRASQTAHASTGDVVTTSTYGGAGAPAHALTSTKTGAAAAVPYTYFSTGATKTRPGVQGTQSMSWNFAHQLASATEPAAGTRPAKNTKYVYDADGELLIRRTPTGNGESVLYLGDTEVHLKVTGTTKTLSGNRYYSFAGQRIGVRTATAGAAGSVLTWLLGDSHGTSSLAVDTVTNALTRRHTTVFGAPRGPNTTWVDDTGFLGKPRDTTTGLTHIGAREYDPATATFLSVDPVLDPANPQSLNAYSYADNNPATLSDPTGLRPDPGTGGGWTPGQNGRPADPPGNRASTAGNGSRHHNSSNGHTRSRATPHGAAPTERRNGGYADWHEKLADEQTRGSVLDIYDGPSAPHVDQLGIIVKELSGYNDGQGCTDGSIGSCALLGAAFIPPAKIAQVAWKTWRAGKAAGSAIAAARAGEAAAKAANSGKTATKAATATKTACFVAGTQVLLGDGTRKAIEDVRVGDQVASYNPETGKQETRRVARTFVHENVPTFDVTVDGATVTTTEEHPFFVVGKGWTSVRDLRPGDQLHEPDGSTVAVQAVNASGQTATVYNFEVEGTHDYYVQVGDHWVLVHNDCGGLLKQSVSIAEHSNARALAGDGTHYVKGVHPDALANYVDGVLEGNVPNVVTRYGIDNGRVGYWDPGKGAAIIEDGMGGTVFTPTNGYSWFTDVLK